MPNPLSPPSSWIMRFAPLVRPRGPVLDVACGGGRHLRFFHAAGHPVTGIDVDLDAVRDLAGQPGVELVAADLEGEGWPLSSSRRFAAVVVTNYLHRPLFPALLSALEPEGILLYETFMQGNQRLGRPSRPDFLLEDRELVERVRGRLHLVAFEQGEVTVPRPAVIQRLAAVAAPDPRPLPPT